MIFEYIINDINWNTKRFYNLNEGVLLDLPKNYKINCEIPNINYYYDSDTKSWKIEYNNEVYSDDIGNTYHFDSSDKCKDFIKEVFFDELEEFALKQIEEKECINIETYSNCEININ